MPLVTAIPRQQGVLTLFNMLFAHRRINSNFTTHPMQARSLKYHYSSGVQEKMILLQNPDQGKNSTPSEKRIDYFTFGLQKPGRFDNSNSYRYAFQGQESDPEKTGDHGGSYNYTYRMHDPRIGRFFTVDPLVRYYAYNSPYAFSENRVIDGIDLEGLEYYDADDIAPDFYGITNYGGVSGSFASWIGKGFDYFKGKTSDCLTSCLIVYANSNDVVAEYLRNMPISPYPVIAFFKHTGRYEDSGNYHSFIPPAQIQDAKRGDILYIEYPGSFDEGYVDHAVILGSDPVFSDDGLSVSFEVHTTGGQTEDGQYVNFGKNTYTFSRRTVESNVWTQQTPYGPASGVAVLGFFRVDQLGLIKEDAKKYVLEKATPIGAKTIPSNIEIKPVDPNIINGGLGGNTSNEDGKKKSTPDPPSHR
jgi:RHS repeat-associated protein